MKKTFIFLGIVLALLLLVFLIMFLVFYPASHYLGNHRPPKIIKILEQLDINNVQIIDILDLDPNNTNDSSAAYEIYLIVNLEEWYNLQKKLSLKDPSTGTTKYERRHIVKKLKELGYSAPEEFALYIYAFESGNLYIHGFVTKYKLNTSEYFIILKYSIDSNLI